MPCTKNFAGCFCRTCQLQRAAFPGVCQFPGFTTISILSASIDVVWQIPAAFTLVLHRFRRLICKVRRVGHPKAIPVNAPWDEAKALQRPLPEGLMIVRRGADEEDQMVTA
jgi:hypothetical protein